MDMNGLIRRELDEIEKKEDVHILYCAESGSRAWGFPSPDSDYDARIVYVRRPEFYLKLEHTRDVIEWKLDDTYDINGWDIQKLFRLLYKSNPVIFEWCSSPIVYKDTALWDSHRDGIFAFFDSRTALCHYISMAKNRLKTQFDDEIIIYKRYFYILRDILCCEWIFDRAAPPPMLLTELTVEYLPDEFHGIVGELLTKKMSGELGKGPQIPELSAYIREKAGSLDKRISALEKSASPDWDGLDRMFLDILEKAWS